MHDHHQVGRTLVHGDADGAHIDRQARRRNGDAVLHLHLRDIEMVPMSKVTEIVKRPSPVEFDDSRSCSRRR